MAEPHAQTYTVTVPDEATARTVAGRLAERGHRLVAVRIVDHYSFDPGSFWYGKPSQRPEYAGWWDVFSMVQDPAAPADQDRWRQWEEAAVAAVAREHGGTSTGAGGGHPETVLRFFSRDGLVHEVDEETVLRRRREVLAAAPAPAAAPPDEPAGLRHVAESRGRTEVLVVREVAARMAEGSSFLADDADLDDAADVLAELFDEALHQDTCYPWTASRVPLFAALAVDDRLTHFHRAVVLTGLYLIATVGRRHLAAVADSLHALGRPAAEAPDALAARAAVAAALPAVLARAGDSELTAFGAAALRAACPETATGTTGAWARRYDGTSRAPVAALIDGLAGADPAAVDTALGRLAAAEHHLAGPSAITEHRALVVLGDLLLAELSRAAG